eukprot:CAMPEP_0202460448 /NCGR_PEP_ID=MMETSP1360-20130828/44018_1 /ASSEMBLY_ACC=CAM_ASM_000848 /TAXON_ID=515479 /ORGANISM="Licmophora paradoxa, Strain CCMP2313" /LENGTH=466 /DNA_ID=CAMNT_0049082107 /DNA_START=40 /DNA_END=1440 /DNA_ORIENTATION=-
MSKRRLIRDEPTLNSFRATDENPRRAAGERTPSEMLKDDLDHPIVQCQSFQPCVDDFMANGPSADMDKLKDLAAEIASQHSNVDPRSLSKSLSSFGRLPSGSDIGGSSTFLNDASVQSFSSLVEFENKRSQSWQESVKHLIENQTTDDLMHKEYKFQESSKEHKLSSKDWDISVNMESMLMQPGDNVPDKADASDVTSDIVTSVKMNQDQSNERKHSVDIRSVAIGRDTDGRMASYELLKTTFNLTPTSLNTLHGLPMNKLNIGQDRKSEFSQNSMNLDPKDLEPTPINNMGAYGQPSNIHPQMMPPPPPVISGHNPYASVVQPPGPMLSMPMGIPKQPSIPNAPTGFVVPPKSTIKLNNETGIIDAHAIKDDDVLLERGGKGNHHKGSRYYRRLINERRRSYQDLPDAARAEKMNISLSIVLSLKATGARFIHKKAGKYMVMSDREARNKISQALREKKERIMLD